jgi:thymidine phosphorylase
MLAGQGADLAAFNRKLAQDVIAPVVVELKAHKSGFVSRCDARVIGEIVRDLGGGRLTKESVINYDVGIDSLAKPGDRVVKGSVLARVHAADKSQASNVVKRLTSAFAFSSLPFRVGPLIVGTIVK